MSPLSSRSTIGTAASAAAATTTRAQPDGDPIVGQPVVTVTPLLIRYPFRTKHPDHVQVITPPHPSPPILEAAVATTATASTSTTTTNGSHSSHADGNNVVGASTAAQFPADALGLRVSPPGTSEELRRRRLGPGAARDNQSHPDGHQDEDSKPSAIPTTTTTTTAVTTTTTATAINPQSFSTRETRRNTYHDGTTTNTNTNNSRSTKKQKTSHSATAIAVAATTVTVAPAVATTIGTTVPAETTTTMEYSARNRRSKCRKRSISRRNNRRKRKRGPIVVDDNGEDGPFYEIGKILAKRQRQDSDGLVNDSNDDDDDDDDEQEEEQLEYLIRWKGCDSNEDCWVPAGDLCDTAWDDVKGEKLDIPWYHDYYDHHANDQHANDPQQQQQGGGGDAVVMAAAAVYREHEKRWDSNFEKLQQYKIVHGDCNVPANYALDKSLARWVQKQRHQGMLKRRRGQQTPLTNRREEKLNSIGFAWSLVLAVQPNENDDDDTLSDEAEAASEQQQQQPWEYQFEKLEQYKAVHGHCRVPSKYALDRSLGRWVKEQRHQGALRRKHLTSTVSKWRLEKLNSIGFVWDNNENDDDDDEEQQQGQSTAARQGRRKNAALPQQEYRTRPPPPPPPQQEQEQQRRVGHYLEEQWEAQFEKLQQYKNEHGHCRVPVAYPRDRTLGNWVHKQRSQGALKRKGLHSTLTDQREQKLNGIGFSWDWSSTPRHISTTSANESGGDDNDDDDDDEPPRQQHEPEQRVLANENAYSKFSDEQWESHFAKLQRYKELHGDCMVPTEYELDLPLGYWVRRQRYQRARKHQGLESTLTDQRELRLDAIGFVWKASRGRIKDRVNESDDTLEQEEEDDEEEKDDEEEEDEDDEPEDVANNSVWEERWETMFQKVKRYKEVHGDCMIPTKNYSVDKKLGHWVRTQRSQRVLKYQGRKSGLTDLREQKLDEIGFVWDATRPPVQQQEQEQHEAEVVGNSLEEQWEAQFQKLQRYKKVHGDCRVPTKNPHFKKLGVWVRTQRYQRMRKYQGRNSSLTDRREQKLNAIGFIWDVAGFLRQSKKPANKGGRPLHRRK